jgi:hypothetical protein
MRFTSVEFVAYKSLRNQRLDLSHGLIGLVGINESGKSNVLTALELLSAQNHLTKLDSPKANRKIDPYLRFHFVLTNEELTNFKNLLLELGDKVFLDPILKSITDLAVTYHIRFDKKANQELRYFTFDNMNLGSRVNVLRNDAQTAGCFFKFSSGRVPLADAILVSNSALEENQRFSNISTEWANISEKAEALKTEIEGLDALALASAADAGPTNANAPLATPALLNTRPEIDVKREQFTQLSKSKNQLSDLLGDMNIERERRVVKQLMNTIEYGVTGLVSETTPLQDELAKLEALATRNDTQQKRMAEIQHNLASLSERIASQTSDKSKAEQILSAMQQPLSEKYTNQVDIVLETLATRFSSHFSQLLPKVVFWKYSPDYVLQGEIDFSSLRSAQAINEVSRPLVNLFRIALNQSFELMSDLIAVLDEIQTDGSERSKIQQRLNNHIDKYLKNVWEDYDKKVDIVLEQERIRVYFYDPKHGDPSYFSMQEGSDGAQTFISFLLTIGAEAKHGVIRNTLLLLDEPETHLHPSGVRFMMRELDRAAEKGNTVVFATHSVFMIDRQHPNRYVIVKKIKEATFLQPSEINRIGYFMQEEVLYSALNFDPVQEFLPRHQYNFVAEGIGDVVLLEWFFTKQLQTEKRVFAPEKTTFHHGGKCDDIEKIFKKKPILLGTTWIFILDNDGPANSLRKFLEGRYTDFIDSYVYIFQYAKGDRSPPIELEDLLPPQLISDVVRDAAKQLQFQNDVDSIETDQRFAEYFDAIAAKVGHDDFKGTVKEILNKRIRDAAESSDQDTSILQFAPDYVTWVTSIFDHISATRPTRNNRPVATSSAGSTRKPNTSRADETASPFAPKSEPLASH